MSIIKINGIEMYYEQKGKGEHLLLISGLSSRTDVWSKIVDDLAKHFLVTSFDNRGAGQTTQPKENYTIEQMANDVNVFMDAIGISSAYVIGHSMGGAILQSLCINYPQKVKGAIIAASTSKINEAGYMLLETTAKLIAGGVAIDLIIDSVIPLLFGSAFLKNKEQLKEEIIRMREDPYAQSYEGYIGQLNALRTVDLTPNLNKIKCPILVLAGLEDILLPAEHSKKIADLIPNAKYEVFDDCGHMLNREKPKEFVDHILRFFR